LPENDPFNPYQGDDNRLQREITEASHLAARNFFDEMCASPADKPTPRPSLDSVIGMLNTLVRREPVLDMCPAGISQLVVDSFGDMYPCWMFAGMDQFKMGNVLRNDVLNEIGAKVDKRIRVNTKAANPQCSSCYARNVCHACLGNNQNATGQIERADEHFCNSIRATLQAVLVQIGEAKQEPERWARIRTAAAQMKTGKAASSAC
jgi:radical SAM protein with 4Fe4S-binding SPASM domain